MHIVYLVHDFPAKGLSTGGAGHYVANMARIMTAKGHKVDVVTESSDEETFEWEGIKVHHIRATKGFKNDGRPMTVLKKVAKNLCRSYWYNKEVKKLHKQEKVDLVQSVNAFGIAIFRTKKIPYIVRMSSYPALWGGAARIEFNFDKCVETRRIDEEMQFIALKRADKVIAPSVIVKELVEKRINKDVLVVESPVVVPNESILEFVEPSLERNKYLVTYGTLNYRKEIHILAEIIDDCLDKYPDMKFVAIGKDREILHDGSFMKASEYLDMHIIRNKERFVFTGEISDRERLFSIVKNAYACVLPTRIDNLPNTVLESMALGKVIISTTSERGTSVEQVITDGNNGFLAQVDDACSLVGKIDTVMKLTEEKKIDMEKAARARVEKLKPEFVYEKMMSVYENLIR